MHELLAHLARVFLSMGAFGLVLLGALDSSFLFFPLGNDLLITLLATQHPQRVIFYAFAAATGSLIGCAFTDWVSRKGGEEGLKGRVSPRRLAYVQRQVEKRAWLMLAFASLMPPPFPFTVVVIVAAALQYPRVKLLGTIAVARLARFLIVGWLAVHFGRRILEIAQTPAVQGVVLAIVAISIGGSAWSIWTWVQRSKRSRRPQKAA